MPSELLSARQTRFVQEYDGCGAQAAIRCGIAASGAHVWASRTLRVTKVAAALQARQSADATRLSIRREDVLNGLREAVELARTQGNPMAMIRGWAEITKLMGLASPERVRVELSVGGQAVLDNYNSLSDAELLEIISAKQAA